MHTISYSYGALHNAPGHIGQFCNPKFFSTYFFQKQNSTKAADYFCYKRGNKGNHKFPKLLLKDTHAALQSGSLISTTQSSPLSHIRTWANRSIWFHIQRCVTDGGTRDTVGNMITWLTLTYIRNMSDTQQLTKFRASGAKNYPWRTFIIWYRCFSDLCDLF